MNKRITISTTILAIVVVGTVFYWQRGVFLENEGATSIDPIAREIFEDGGEVESTRGVKHIVPLDEVMGGGPPKDGIPSIDDPKFVSIAQARDFLDDSEPGVAVSIDGINRFYPYQILVWHEIVNDTFNEKRVLVTYCPLCLSGIVFDPIVAGERVEFGTSGKLWQSNLVMYDRKTDTYWSQVLGQAIIGDLAGEKLPLLPSDQLQFGQWREAFPNGQVLSKETGAVRFYGVDPYGDYYSDNNHLIGSVNHEDNRLERKELILGILVDNSPKAYHIAAVKRAGLVRDVLNGQTIVLEYDTELDVVRMYTESEDGESERLNSFSTFWFSWVAAHPTTELYK